MDSKLLAFRLAGPAEPAGDLIGFSYDPQSQTATWSGNGAANASLHCTYNASTFAIGGYRCNAYGNYCATYDGAGLWFCDY
jgi:hypothetical protein